MDELLEGDDLELEHVLEHHNLTVCTAKTPAPASMDGRPARIRPVFAPGA